MDLLLDAAEPLGAYAMAYSYGGYTTNLAIEDLSDGKARVVTEHEASRSSARTAARRGACSSPTCTSGSRRNGLPDCGSWTMTSRVFGKPTAATTVATPGRRSATGPIDRDGGFAACAGSLRRIARRHAVREETARMKTFRLALPMWMPFLPGQHMDVRLTAPDGYRAQRPYSIASSPLDEGEIELTIDRLEEGEVSGYFHDVVVEGDLVEVRGPFASYFVWRGEAPALLIGGGSGVVPLMAIATVAGRC